VSMIIIVTYHLMLENEGTRDTRILWRQANPYPTRLRFQNQDKHTNMHTDIHTERHARLLI
jgi:hypothetical protein